MAAYKFSMIFTYMSGISATNSVPVRIGGWTESYYADNYNGTVFDAFKVLIQKRLGMCAMGTYVNKIRVQQVDPALSASLSKVSYAAPSTFPSDVPQMALKVPFFLGTVTGQILREFRGVPDTQVELGEYAPTMPYSVAVATFLAELCNGTWKARRRNKANTQYQILSVSDTGMVIMTDPFLGIGVGDPVQVIRTVNPQTGRKFGYFAKVQAFTDTQHFQIVGPKVKPSGFGKMRFQAVVYNAFASPQSAEYEVVVRKIGRPFRAYSGRASKRQ